MVFYTILFYLHLVTIVHETHHLKAYQAVEMSNYWLSDIKQSDQRFHKRDISRSKLLQIHSHQVNIELAKFLRFGYRA